MKRGDLVTVVASKDYGKPRPAVSITVLPLSSDLHDAPAIRVDIEPGGGTGLRLRSQIMVDKASTLPRTKAGGPIGRVDDATLETVSRRLATFLGLA